jgi:3-oxoadipate enol-lactonase
MPYIDAPDLRIHYRMSGAGLTPIVFLHGNYASSRWWEPLLACVPGAYRALAPDLRGCGSRGHRSTWMGYPTRRIRIDDLVLDLEAFLSGLEMERVVLVGHSLGGLIATSFAIRHPGKVLALVLEDTGPAEGINLGSVTTPFLLPFELKNRRLLKFGLERAGIPSQGPLARSLVDDALSAPRGLYYQFAKAAAAWEASKKLEHITAPTLLLWGHDDRVMPSRYAQTYLEQIPDSRLVLIEGAGHSPHLEQPMRFTDALYLFLDQHTANGGKTNGVEPCLDTISQLLSAS